jgi:hypothetical protein
MKVARWPIVRHLLRPGHYIRMLRERISRWKGNLLSRSVRRESQTTRWCGTTLSDVQVHQNYYARKACGTYVNVRPPRRDELGKLYGFNFYWRTICHKTACVPGSQPRPGSIVARSTAHRPETRRKRSHFAARTRRNFLYFLMTHSPTPTCCASARSVQCHA